MERANVRPFSVRNRPASARTPLRRGTNLAPRGESDRHDHLPPAQLLHLPAQFQLRVDGGGPQVVHVQRRCDKAQRRLGVHRPILGPVQRGGRGARRVAIDQRRDQPAVDVAGDRRVIRPRLKMADSLIAFPVALDLQAVLVQPAAAVALGNVVGVVVLKGSWFHICIVPDFLELSISRPALPNVVEGIIVG